MHLSLAKQHPSSDAAAIAQAKLLACVDKSGCTPLHIAAIYGNRDCAQALLAAGAHLEAEDDEGQTPLLSAASFGHVEVVDVLLARGADATKRDKMGRTGKAVAGVGGVFGGSC